MLSKENQNVQKCYVEHPSVNKLWQLPVLAPHPHIHVWLSYSQSYVSTIPHRPFTTEG